MNKPIHGRNKLKTKDPDSLFISGVQQVGATPPFDINLGTIDVDGSLTLSFQVSTDCIPSAGEYANQSSFDFEYQIGGNIYHGKGFSTHAITGAEQVIVNLIKTVDLPIADPGDILNYSIVVSNKGTVSLDNVVFSDLLPPCTSYVTDSFTVGGIGQPGIPPFNYNLGTVLAGDDITITFQLLITCIPNPAEIDNQATIAFDYLIGGVSDSGTSSVHS